MLKISYQYKNDLIFHINEINQSINEINNRSWKQCFTLTLSNRQLQNMIIFMKKILFDDFETIMGYK